MRYQSIKRVILVAGLLTAMPFGLCANADLTIQSGWDWIITQSGSAVNLSWLPVPPNSSTWVPMKSFPYSNPLARVLWGDPTPGPPTIVVFRTTWYDPHHNVVGPESKHAVSQITTPVTIVNGNFDTVIRRGNDATLDGIGSEASVSIGVDWLSLKSSSSIYIPGGAIPGVSDGTYDLYVGVNKSPHTEPDTGWFRLRSDTLDGSHGHINMGVIGDPVDTTHLFADSSSDLGLPLNWRAYIVPAGLDPSPIYPYLNDFSIFHNEPWKPEFQVVPEPATLTLALSGFATFWAIRHRRQTTE